MSEIVVRKAIFPVAGLGTRFLPATKANPKEMLPIVDKPLIQYAVEEAIASGITELIFVTSSNKRAIEDHFDTQFELEYMLTRKQDWARLKQVQNVVPAGVTCLYVRQREPLGLGHAIWCAREIIGEEYFAVILADDLIAANKPCLAQLLSVFDESPSSVIAVERVPPERINQYGIVSGAFEERSVFEIESIVEKPSLERAPSDLGVVGRYILSPRIFDLIERDQTQGEIQLTDAISLLIDEEPVVACQFEGIRYDCGSKAGYVAATIDYALKHPEISEAVREHILNTAEKIELA